MTRGVTLSDLARPNQFSHNPAFLQQPRDGWQSSPSVAEILRSVALCQPSVFQRPQLLKTTPPSNISLRQQCHCTAWPPSQAPSVQMTTQEPNSKSFRDCKAIAFQSKIKCLQTGKAVPSSSRLLTLAPQYDISKGLIHVGGRLCHSTSMEEDVMHPIVQEPKHPVIKFIMIV